MPDNRFAVAAATVGQGARVIAPPAGDRDLSREESLELAAWLVVQSGAELAVLAMQVASILGADDDAFEEMMRGERNASE